MLEDEIFIEFVEKICVDIKEVIGCIVLVGIVVNVLLVWMCIRVVKLDGCYYLLVNDDIN